MADIFPLCFTDWKELNRDLCVSDKKRDEVAELED
jgi:hypothetical protein